MKVHAGKLILIEAGGPGATQLAIVVDPEPEPNRVAIRSWSVRSSSWSLPRSVLRRKVLGTPERGDERVAPAREALAAEGGGARC